MSKRTRMTLILVLLIGFVTAGTAVANLTLPYEGSVSEPGEAFRVSNTYIGSTRSYGGYFSTSGAQGRGVYGRCSSTVADANSYGGFFYAAAPQGRGCFGQSAGSKGMGVKGWASNSGNVVNYGGHFCATGLRGIGVYGWAENVSSAAANYGGYFQADGGQGIGIYAIGGQKGAAGVFQGDIVITGKGNGIVFPDGSKQTSAAGEGSTSSGGGCCCPEPAYDSGWVDLTFSKSARLTHGVGGNLDDYVVDLELKRDNIVGEQSLTNREIGTDFYYDRLTTSTVMIYGPEMAGMDFGAWVRIRIWLCPSDGSSPGGPIPR